MKLKPFIRVIGIDDGFFHPKTIDETILVGVVFRLDNRVEGILAEKIEVDALDAGEKIEKMVLHSKFRKQIQIVFLHGINFAGFNIVDVKELHKKLRLPIIVCFRKKPDMKKIFSALNNFSDGKKRIALIEQGGKIFGFEKIFFQCIGINSIEAKRLIKKTLYYSNMPEPLRLAHLIASGTSKPLKEVL